MTLTVEISDELAACARRAGLSTETLRPAIRAVIERALEEAGRLPEESAAAALTGFINQFSAPAPTDGPAWSQREGFDGE